MRIPLLGLSDTKSLAHLLAKHIEKGEAVALKGDLGTGKTTFSRYLIRALSGEGTEVPSPTFTLVQLYDTPYFPLWHFDLYRLNRQEEAFELGIEEAFTEAVSLIEWPEVIEALLPKDRVEIALHFTDGTEKREAVLTGYGTWIEKLCAIY